MERLHLIILAAGKGTRMRSALPKVLQPLGGRPMLAHVLERADRLEASAVHVVVSHGREAVQAAFAQREDLRWVDQGHPGGTGHAVARALEGIPDGARVLVLYGDVPRIPLADLEGCARTRETLTVLGTRVADPRGYGRLIEDARGNLERIVEDKETDAAEAAVNRINTGVLAGDAVALRRWLGACEPPADAEREWYLTDVVAVARGEGQSVALIDSQDPDAVLGVNDRAQLAVQERLLQREIADESMREGLALADPARFDCRGTLEFGRDCRLDVNVVVEGTVILGDDVEIGAGCVLRDCRIASGARLQPYTVVEGARLGERAEAGPFARLRPGADLGEGARVGNFVEVKNARLESGAKANHLAYVGDARVGTGANLGAGTITCNYDGANKHHTEIGADAFIGSNTALVAPVSIGAGATVGAGSTISRDVPAGALALTRAPARTVEGWQRPARKPKSGEAGTGETEDGD
ncbi:bifunctional UDP-N-acetylglucosamine diphosphorylase/glucosamine-1-phosphate N-acetyltransferase GlmU [Thioalkalivibrio sp. ALE19]|uniref:bifunctional UDP-N-acetylglucosamine diphosphorylase/glucosamine-1-phosphate N-acetyltransferase GlmU n=1 Tax=Thioalkalivibrio sp. ALE19 TaxID=1266909 RepID=UPI00041E7402|nr:bifunctional UDP-N-acetylglucosamine diphosphorylase/glucosamine-1-phosphate N-acetyltransferase GlmU [Thioalkalivibrio sp. ALE19]